MCNLFSLRSLDLFLTLLLLHLLKQHLLDNLLLLDEEGAHDAGAHASGAARAAVCARYGLLAFLRVLVVIHLEVLDTRQADLAVAALRAGRLLLKVLERNVASRSLYLDATVGLRRVRMPPAEGNTVVAHDQVVVVYGTATHEVAIFAKKTRALVNQRFQRYSEIRMASL